MLEIIRRFDTSVTTLIAGIPVSLNTFFLGITALGDPFVTVGIGLVVAFYGYLHTNYRLLIAGLSVPATLVIGSIIKLLTARARPLTEYAANMHIKTFSFPSGHSSGSMVAYGLLAYLAWHFLPQPWNYIVAALLIVLIILIGISRVYLGAHFPSDVLAGWLLGLIILGIVVYAIKPLA